MIDIASISAVVAALGVIIGVVFTAMELRNLVKTRQIDLVVRLYSTMGSKDMLEAWEKIKTSEYKDINAYIKEHGLSEVHEVGVFYEGIGVLLRRKLIDISLVDDLFSTPIKSIWEKLKPIVEWQRKQPSLPTP